jgi:hypothetical protein
LRRSSSQGVDRGSSRRDCATTTATGGQQPGGWANVETLIGQSQGRMVEGVVGLKPVVILSASGSNLPYVGNSTDPGAYNGQSFNYNAYHEPVGGSYQWNLQVQRSVPKAFAIYGAPHALWTGKSELRARRDSVTGLNLDETNF